MAHLSQPYTRKSEMLAKSSFFENREFFWIAFPMRDTSEKILVSQKSLYFLTGKHGEKSHNGEKTSIFSEVSRIENAIQKNSQFSKKLDFANFSDFQSNPARNIGFDYY